MSRIVVIRCSEDDAEEIAEALVSKRWLVDQGTYDPMEPGERRRWSAHLTRLEEMVHEAPVEVDSLLEKDEGV